MKQRLVNLAKEHMRREGARTKSKVPGHTHGLRKEEAPPSKRKHDMERKEENQDGPLLTRSSFTRNQMEGQRTLDLVPKI